MTQYWSMKTFQNWWDVFNSDSLIGIDQDGVNADYRTLSNEQIQQLYSDDCLSDSYTEYIDRIFREFSNMMEIGDYVIVGTGRVASFNVNGIARITGDYFYDQASVPRHIRTVDFLATFSNAVPMQIFARSSRLEPIHETDFIQAVISLVQT